MILISSTCSGDNFAYPQEH